MLHKYKLYVLTCFAIWGNQQVDCTQVLEYSERH